ncbi:MAG: MGMT family protein [Candidatus Diapherotrites archaeon]|nr:MGMT family protein [Candidatus Diapherotrites archaeon]
MDNELIWSLLRKIPKGKLTTYKQLAKALKTSPRAVGRALHFNKDPKNIPCYKVVYSDGRLGGYALGLKKKKKRLANDGILTEDGKVVDFSDKIVVWDSGGWI